MREWVLRVGDANVKQNDKEKVELGLSFRERAGQTVGRNCIVISTSDPETGHVHTEVPRPPPFQKIKNENRQLSPPSETHLLSLQSPTRFPLKMEIRLRQEEIHTAGHHLRMPFTFRTGTSLVYICLSLIA